MQEEKVKTALGADTVKEVEGWVKDGIDWLDEHASEEKDVYVAKQKEYEEKIRPVMMKLYQDAGAPGSSETADVQEPKASAGPSVEEVD